MTQTNPKIRYFRLMGRLEWMTWSSNGLLRSTCLASSLSRLLLPWQSLPSSTGLYAASFIFVSIVNRAAWFALEISD